MHSNYDHFCLNPRQKQTKNVSSINAYKGIATRAWLKISGGVTHAAITHENNRKYLLCIIQKSSVVKPNNNEITVKKGI